MTNKEKSQEINRLNDDLLYVERMLFSRYEELESKEKTLTHLIKALQSSNERIQSLVRQVNAQERLILMMRS